MNDFELGWVVGILEGEGCWHRVAAGSGKRFMISMASTDEDVIRRVHAYTGVGRINGPYLTENNIARGQRKPQWWFMVGRQEEVRQLSHTLLPHMCERRADKIKELLGGCT